MIIDPLKEVFICLLKSTVQLFTKTYKSSRPNPFGCVILFEYNSRYYCFSCAHVLSSDNLKKVMFRTGNGNFRSIGGHLINSIIPESKKVDEDLHDIAIVELGEETVLKFKEAGYHFIGIKSIITGHVPNVGDILLVAGYPWRKTTLQMRRKVINSKPLFLKTSPYLNELTKEKYSSSCHLFATYRRRSIQCAKTGKKSKGPKPAGISGSGLWLLTNEEGLYKPALIGIQSAYLENKALIVSTRIDLFIDIIRQKIDPSIPNNGVKLSIPKSEI